MIFRSLRLLELLCKDALIRAFLNCLLFVPALKSAAQPLTITENKQRRQIEIRNGLLGIVLPSGDAFRKGQPVPAPIQSFIYRDATLSDNTLNFLQTARPAIAFEAKMLSKTADIITVRLKYIFSKEKFSYGRPDFPGSEPGPGYYTCTISIRRGEKSILIEEDTDYDILYSVKINNGFIPDKARYRGWNAAGVQYGYEKPGQVYRSEDERQYPMDATIDLNFSKEFTYPKLTLWEPAGGEQNSGRYWMVFNSKLNDKLFGFMQGAPGRLIGGKQVGPALDIKPVDTSNGQENDAELKVEIYRRAADNSWFPRKRFQWAAYISSTSDVYSAEKVQPINLELNRIAGMASVVRQYGDKRPKIVAGFYEGAIYMPAEKIAGLIDRVKNDNLFYQKMLQTEGGYQMLWDAWHSHQKAREAISYLIKYKAELEELYVSGEGSYRRDVRYWKGSAGFKFYAILISCLFADKTTLITAAERESLEKLVGLMARIVWNENNVPLYDSAGVNLGPANMAYQYRNNGRYFFALLLKDDPEFSAIAKNINQAIKKDINEAIDANGSSFGSPHYTQAVIDPILFSVLQLKQAGLSDFFLTEKKLHSFARFYISLLTPPSCRFLKYRKLISFGDGFEESAACFGLLAAGFKDIDPGLSKSLSTAYHYGPPAVSYHGLIRLAADSFEPTDSTIQGGNANYPGYLSHFRYNINKRDESAFWILNGNRFYDHRNDDEGETAIYALGAPLSLSRSSFYYPWASDSRIRSMVVPAEGFPGWSVGEQPIAERSSVERTWSNADLIEYANLGYGNCATVLMEAKNGQRWRRQVMMLTVPNGTPIFMYYDSVSGNKPFVWSMTMMSDGAISTPAGMVIPVKRTYDYKETGKHQLPLGSGAYPVGPAVQVFRFKGQAWPAHPTGGIDWYLCTNSPRQMEFSLSDWETTWQNQTEQEQFQKTNFRPYSEEQQIIRFKTTGAFFGIILPYYKGDDIYGGGIKKNPDGSGMIVHSNEWNIELAGNGYRGRGKATIIVGAWSDAGQFSSDGYEIRGGPAELEYGNEILKVRIHGNSGKRSLTVPFEVKAESNASEIHLSKSNHATTIKIDYLKSDNDLSNTGKGYTEYIFRSSGER